MIKVSIISSGTSTNRGPPGEMQGEEHSLVPVIFVPKVNLKIRS